MMKIIFLFCLHFIFVLENYFCFQEKKILAYIIKLEIRVSQNLEVSHDGTSMKFFLLRREASVYRYAQQIQIIVEVFVTRYILMDVLNVLAYTESICR